MTDRIEWKVGDRCRVRGLKRMGVAEVRRVYRFRARVAWTKRNTVWVASVRRMDMEPSNG